ncbi:hypothetical protein [Wolbachia endosymbiont of Ceratosolen solmsi]|uniref:hypothetical protein n=1 Tax=Wolbachia endosymbiont of Ceratosolen solmsi TaxID=497299 RepID=UPI001FD530E7|nr:hypothetical protein [Wolbachia endosymbiont of Ceratosolen solmsi]
MSGCNPSVPMMSSQCPDTGIQEKEWCHESSLLSSQCIDYLDPENLTLNKWLHNKD